jgi:hypothetical protein
MLPKSDEAMTPKNGGIQRLERNGAGEGNRTLVASLEGWSFTIKLHPQIAGNHYKTFTKKQILVSSDKLLIFL